MKSNSIRGYAETSAIAVGGTEGLVRLCNTGSDGILQAPPSRGIERIEARFSGQGFEPHRHDTYALGLTLSGVQTFRYRGASRFSLPGNIIILHPDEVHDGAAGTDSGLSYRMLYLPPERLIEAADTLRSLPFVADPVISDVTFQRCLSEALCQIETRLDDLQLDDLIGRFAEGLGRHSGQQSRTSNRIAVKAVLLCREFLQDNCDRVVSSGELEAICGLDRYTLARHFRCLLGTSPHRYLLMRRLDKAKAWLSKGANLADVAVSSGFADQAHFTRHFKKTFGITPGHWKGLTSAASRRVAI
ncbi:AraC family transcriptional regulator [Phyllobacterium sp. 22552]|uniref:AraC family transcriptional regulator n=1 Tax=Phyllobacterium sp. 22552 TaxID=3453941 RepID=UPI003F83A451